MKKLVLATGLLLVSAVSAQAQLNVDLNLGGPAYVEPRPVYVEPRPVYVAPRPIYVAPRPIYRTYGHGDHHHNYDYDYWRDDHHDNGRHEGWRPGPVHR